MKYVRGFYAVLFVAGLIASSAGPASALTPAWGHHGGEQYIAGQYAGTVTDSSLGSGTATADLATLEGTAGGWFGFTFGSGTDMWAVSAYTGRGLRGVFVNTIGSTACTFAFEAQYESSDYTLNGKYKAINGCSGENGTFSLTEQCYYQERGDVRRDGGLGHC